jgi:hypothetical protein
VNLLVVDWAHLTGIDPAWERTDALGSVSLVDIWPARAAEYVARGVRPHHAGGHAGFWSQFTLAVGADGFVADRHALAFDEAVHDPAPSDVWFYGTHHAAGYRPDAVETVAESGRISTDDWMIAYHLLGAQLHVVAHGLQGPITPAVPLRIHSPADLRPPTIHRVVILRSGHWVGPWNDEAFVEFVEACPVELEPLEDVSPRPLDMAMVSLIARDLQRSPKIPT